MLTEKQMVSRVRKGIKFLNSVKAGWHKRIKLKSLDLYDDEHCILGQMNEDGGNFFDTAENLFTEDTYLCDDAVIDLVAPYGLAIECKVQDKLSEEKAEQLHDKLTNVWKVEIKKFHVARKLVKEYYV